MSNHLKPAGSFLAPGIGGTLVARRLVPDFLGFRRLVQVFAIDWLREGFPVERETSVLPEVEGAVAAARSRAAGIRARHRGREPNSFRLIDPTGAVVGTYKVVGHNE
jgi:hypothetical protein